MAVKARKAPTTVMSVSETIAIRLAIRRRRGEANIAEARAPLRRNARLCLARASRSRRRSERCRLGVDSPPAGARVADALTVQNV